MPALLLNLHPNYLIKMKQAITEKEKKILEFNPNAAGAADANLFGLPFTESESEIVILPVPWEVTVSYRTGTAKAPRAILNASMQVDLFHPLVANGWQHGFFLKKEDKKIAAKSKQLRKKAEQVLDFIAQGKSVENKEMKKLIGSINNETAVLKNWVKQEIKKIIAEGKLPALLGGDHSTPLGFIEALAEQYPSFGILQIDAHCDLRNAFEGFEYSHASVMFNALKVKQVKKLVQVGIRDYCEEELNLIKNSKGRVKTFFDAGLKQNEFEGINWKKQCAEIISALPEFVYISFDVDGLLPSLCPNTGTPVPGGLAFEQATYLLTALAQSNKKIIGFDLNEVAPGKDEWDANVGARLLFHLCHVLLFAASKK